MSKERNSLKEPTLSKKRTYSKYAEEAATLLGMHIKAERKKRKWAERDLAERAGISRSTLQKIENGEMNSTLGIVFELAALVGIPLFEQDKPQLSNQINQVNEQIALLPKRIQTKTKVVDDDF